MTAQVALSVGLLSVASRAQLARPYQEILERVRAPPQVRSATLSGTIPVLGAGANRDATVEGYQDKPGDLRYLAENRVAPKCFETFGTPLRGRDFTLQDEGGNRQPNDGAVFLRRGGGRREVHPCARNCGRIIYFHAFQEGSLFSRFSVRTRGAPAAVAGDFRRIVDSVLKKAAVEADYDAGRSGGRQPGSGAADRHALGIVR